MNNTSDSVAQSCENFVTYGVSLKGKFKDFLLAVKNNHLISFFTINVRYINHYHIHADVPNNRCFIPMDPYKDFSLT